MKKHIHEVYGYLGVYSCVSCPKQFTREEINKFHIQIVPVGRQSKPSVSEVSEK